MNNIYDTEICFVCLISANKCCIVYILNIKNGVDRMAINNYDEMGVVALYQRIPYYPIAFERGKGALLYDYDGKEYIDFLASASSANAGHGNEEIAEAVYNQMKNITQ